MSSPTPVALRRDLSRSPVDDRELWRESGQWIPTVGETYYCIFNPMTHEDKTPRNSPATDQGWGRSNTGFPDNFHQNVTPGQIQNPGVARQRWSKKSWIITACAVGLAVVIAFSVGLTMLITGKDDNRAEEPLVNPANWVNNTMMSLGIKEAGGSCTRFEEDYDTRFGMCVNYGHESNYMFVLGDVSIDLLRKSVEDNEDIPVATALAQGDSWAVACIPPTEDLDPVADCQRLASAFGSSEEVVEIDGYDDGAAQDPGDESDQFL